MKGKVLGFSGDTEQITLTIVPMTFMPFRLTLFLTLNWMSLSVLNCWSMSAIHTCVANY